MLSWKHTQFRFTLALSSNFCCSSFPIPFSKAFTMLSVRWYSSSFRKGFTAKQGGKVFFFLGIWTHLLKVAFMLHQYFRKLNCHMFVHRTTFEKTLKTSEQVQCRFNSPTMQKQQLIFNFGCNESSGFGLQIITQILICFNKYWFHHFNSRQTFLYPENTKDSIKE